MIFVIVIYHKFIFLEVDCVWDEWVVGDCSKSCGGGLLTKTRAPLVDAAHGGVNCTGDPVVSESCNVDECPGKFNISLQEAVNITY